VSLHLNRVFFEQNQLGYGAMLSLTVIAVIAGTIGVGRWAATGIERRDRPKAAP
jgi:hypothetical protein